jgi:DNA modification methylase
MKPKATAGGIPVYCAHDKIVNVEEMIPNPKNPNTHPEDQIKLLAKVITEQGWRAPITVSNLSGLVVKGHGRLAAAIHAGLTEAPVDFQDYANEQEEHADLIADNRIAELAEIDDVALAAMLEELEQDEFDIELAGFTEDEYSELLDNVNGGGSQLEEDDYEEPDSLPAKSKRGDVWLLDGHRLMCGDSTSDEDMDILLDGDAVQIVFTDPPYGVAIGTKNQMLNKFQKSGRVLTNIEGDTLSEDDLYEMLTAVFKNVKRVMADDCALYATAPQGGSLGMMMLEMMKSAGLEVKHLLMWIKNSPTFSLGRLDYDYQHEPIMFTWKKTHKKVMKGEHRTSCWFIDKPRESKLHPTMKPIALVANALLNSSNKGDITLDPFGGSGSTLMACEQTGRVCRTMEIDPHYCDVIVDRYTASKESHKGVTLVRDGKKTAYSKVKVEESK